MVLLVACTMSAAELEVKITADKLQFVVGEPIAVWISYENLTRKQVAIPRAQIGTLVVRDNAGQRMPYLGPMTTVLPGTSDTFVLGPKDRQVRLVLLDDAYGVHQPGPYMISAGVDTFHGDTSGGAARSSTVAVAATQSESMPLTLAVVSVNDPGVALVESCTRSKHWFDCLYRVRPKISELGSTTILAPYAEIRSFRERLSHGVEQRNLVGWADGFRARYPSFDQPSYLYAKLAEALRPERDGDQLGSLSTKAAKEFQPDHPLTSFLDQYRAQHLLKKSPVGVRR